MNERHSGGGPSREGARGVAAPGVAARTGAARGARAVRPPESRALEQEGVKSNVGQMMADLCPMVYQPLPNLTIEFPTCVTLL